MLLTAAGARPPAKLDTAKRSRLGTLLLSRGSVTTELLRRGLVNHQSTGRRLGETLGELGLPETEWRQALAAQLGIEFVDLDRLAVGSGVRRLMSGRYAWAHLVLPIARGRDELAVALDDPTDGRCLADLETLALPGALRVLTTTRAALLRALDRLYPRPSTVCAVPVRTWDAEPGGVSRLPVVW